MGEKENVIFSNVFSAIADWVTMLNYVDTFWCSDRYNGVQMVFMQMLY